jgi:Domain of unknown function (DUF4389)
MAAYGPASGLSPVRAGPLLPAPVLVSFTGPAPQSRLTVLVRIVLATPQLIVVTLLSIAAWAVMVAGWSAALFTGRLPGSAAVFLTGFLRWQTRVLAYTVLLTDAYPPFALAAVGYPVQVATAPGRLSRLAVLLRFFLLIPCCLVGSVLSCGAFTIFQPVSWLIVAITGQMPNPVHQALAAAVRYQARVTGFTLMLTGAYPAGLFGDAPGPPGPAASETQPGYGAQRRYPAHRRSRPQPDYGGRVASAGYGPAVPAGPSRALVLSTPARRLVLGFLVLGFLVPGFLVLGVLVAVGGGALDAATSGHGVSAAGAAGQVRADSAPVSNAVSNYPADVKKCNGQLACVTRVDRKAAVTFSMFAGQLRGIAMPSQAVPPTSALVTSVTSTAAIFSRLGAATTAAQYIRLAGTAKLNTSLNQVNQDYENLGKALNS